MPRCKKKQALLAQDLPIMKFNPRMRVGGKGTHTKTGLACARPAYYEVQPAYAG
jgi:hypothetical protein